MGKKKRLQRKRKVFKVFTYRGYSENDLAKMTTEQFYNICGSRARRRLRNGKAPNPSKFFRKVRKAKKECQYGDKPREVKTHLRNLLITPELVGSIVGVHNGQSFIKVDVRQDMMGHKLGEFALTFKPITHGKPGIGGTKSSKFVPLK